MPNLPSTQTMAVGIVSACDCITICPQCGFCCQPCISYGGACTFDSCDAAQPGYAWRWSSNGYWMAHPTPQIGR
jgi:hypothetical protein